jgi:hypothetical protein
VITPLTPVEGSTRAAGAGCLAEIARREQRSVSDLAREIVEQAITRRQAQFEANKQRRLRALERARQVAEAIRQERGGKPLDIDVVETIRQVREDH